MRFYKREDVSGKQTTTSPQERFFLLRGKGLPRETTREPDKACVTSLLPSRCERDEGSQSESVKEPRTQTLQLTTTFTRRTEEGGRGRDVWGGLPAI